MPKTILIVDDDASARLAYGDLFKARGYAVKVAQDGQEAWEVLDKHPVDIVFLDLAMPRMTGEELMEKMAADDKLKKIPVVVESAMGTETIGRAGTVRQKFAGRLKLASFIRPGRLEDILATVDRMAAGSPS